MALELYDTKVLVTGPGFFLYWIEAERSYRLFDWRDELFPALFLTSAQGCNLLRSSTVCKWNLLICFIL